jgi:citrate/tricarballylate utilization protein
MPGEITAHATHVLTVCNACRYCEQYCPVFPAMERRLTFQPADLAYLANLCHNCGECLYACQYAPPHEFGVDVPRTLAQVRLRSYEEYAWPRAFGAAFRTHGLAMAAGLSAVFTGVLFLTAWIAAPGALWRADPAGDFYAVVPHGVLVTVFGSAFGFAMLALGISVWRFVRAVRTAAVPAAAQTPAPGAASLLRAVRDALTLRHLHGSGRDCVSAEEHRRPWRRWLHHLVMYGFGLCFASTTVAAIYHGVFGWRAPYGYSSLPVVLGTFGGIGLLAGSSGLWSLRRRRDPALGDPAQEAFDEAFLALLFVSSLSGLALLALRDRSVMAPLLLVHLGTVLALFVMLPYGKFVHGVYRLAALVIDAGEEGEATAAPTPPS